MFAVQLKQQIKTCAWQVKLKPNTKRNEGMRGRARRGEETSRKRDCLAGARRSYLSAEFDSINSPLTACQADGPSHAPKVTTFERKSEKERAGLANVFAFKKAHIFCLLLLVLFIYYFWARFAWICVTFVLKPWFMACQSIMINVLVAPYTLPPPSSTAAWQKLSFEFIVQPIKYAFRKLINIWQN